MITFSTLFLTLRSLLRKGVCRCYRAREVRVVLSRQTAASELGVVGFMADVNIEKEVEDLFQGAITTVRRITVSIKPGILRASTPAAWMDTFQKSGMKTFTLTTKHHEGSPCTTPKRELRVVQTGQLPAARVWNPAISRTRS
jgi:hypothetical protein